MIYLIIYLIGVLVLVFLSGLFDLNNPIHKKDDTDFVAIIAIWPLIVILILLLIVPFSILRFIYLSGRYLDEKPDKSFWKYLKENFLEI